MKAPAVIVGLLLLAVVPVTITFLTSGEDEDQVRAAPAPDDEEPCAEIPAVPEATDGAKPAASAETRRPIPLSAAKTAVGVPVFKGFEDARYQQYDDQIRKFCEDFNRNRKAWAGSTPGQAEKIAELTPAQVKAHMIQETGGGDLKSRTAWRFDPLQVNVPGDWNPYKKYLGLREPRRRNEGSGAKNLKAGLMLLVRKGFGRSGQPAGNRPDGSFDGWASALKAYNGRSDKTVAGEPYGEAYSARIRKRAANPSVEVPIPIQTKKK